MSALKVCIHARMCVRVYVIRCAKCKTESARPSAFYELDVSLQEHSVLTMCLQDLVKVC